MVTLYEPAISRSPPIAVLSISLQVIQTLGLLGIGIAVFAIRRAAAHGLTKYVEERAKNLASKHDIEELTRKVEGAKLEYAKDLEQFKAENAMGLEQVRADIAKAAHVERLQVETEASALKRIWKAMERLRYAAASLRPAVDVICGDVEGRRDLILQRLSAVEEALNDLGECLNEEKPFISGELVPHFHKFMAGVIGAHARVASAGMQDTIVPGAWMDPDFGAHYQEYIGQLMEQSDAICERIRTHLRRTDRT